jgi:hypothetical protein
LHYHFNWDPHDPHGNGDAGAYTFRVNGNSQAPLVFSETLDCRLPGPNNESSDSVNSEGAVATV